MSDSDRPAVKFIRYNASNINHPDDPSYPFRLEVSLYPPEMMTALFEVLKLETEDLVLRGLTKEALEEVIETLFLRQLPRLRRFILTGPDGVIEEFSQEN